MTRGRRSPLLPHCARSSARGARNTVEGARAVGDLVAQRAREGGIRRAVFDRSGYPYHGKVRALAEAAREGGLEF